MNDQASAARGVKPLTDQTSDAGTPIYDANGRWIGIVSLRNVPGPQLIVQIGRLFPKDICLPADVIAQADDECIYLRLSKDDLKSQRYDRHD